MKTEVKLTGIKLLISDWSGVISDDRPPVYEANMRMLARRGKPTMTFEEWLPRTTMTPIEFLANHGVAGDPQVLFDEYRQEYTLLVGKGTEPRAYDGAKEALGRIRRRTNIVVLSSHPEGNIRAEAEKYGLTAEIEAIVGNVRDKAKGLSEICDQRGVSRTQVAYVGDTIFDIQAAKKAGVRSIGITTGYHIRERLEAEVPDLIVDSLKELSEKISS